MVARQHEKIRHSRRDYQHKLSRRLVDRYGQIFANRLLVRRMLSDDELRHLNLKLADAAWSELLYMIRYKAESAGGVYVEVDARGVAQECSHCGARSYEDLPVRFHGCPRCGLVLPRGANAARNAKNRAVWALRGGD